METHIHNHEFQSANRGGTIIPKQPGYKFIPSDELLIGYYLRRKLANLRLPHNRIFEVELYDWIPKDLSVEYKRRGEKECYFFTSRVRKYKNGNRPNRACKVGGYWKASGADKPVIDRDSNNSLIGYKKALVFYEGKPPNGTKTKWIMHEFRVSEPPPCTRTGPNDMKLDDWVLCKLYENMAAEEESESGEDEEDQELPSLLNVGNNEEEYPEYEEIIAPPICNYNTNFVQMDYCNNGGTHLDNLVHIENDQLPVLDNQLATDHNLQPQKVDNGSQETLQQPANLINCNNYLEMGNLYAAAVSLVAQPTFNEVHPNSIFKSKYLRDQSMSLPEDNQNGFF